MRAILLFSMCFILIGCKTELYSGLTEKEGNEMLSILMDSGIEVEKVFNKKEREITLLVSTGEVSKSVKVLGSLGYPQEKFSSVGDIFPKDGLISSPTEERARYTYSMTQDLSATLSMIDGVVAARVHIVLPQDQDKLSDIIFPSSASVFIKYTSELELSGFVTKVRTLVGNSIEGLELDKITVSLFPASRVGDMSLTRDKIETVFSVDVASGSATRLRVIVIMCFALVIIMILGGSFIFLMFQGKLKMFNIKKKKKKKNNKDGKNYLMDTVNSGINKVKENVKNKKNNKNTQALDDDKDVGLPEFGEDEDEV